MGAMINALETELVKTFGNLWILAVIILVLFMCVMLMAGIDITYVSWFMTPLIMVFSWYGWLPLWAGVCASIVTVGFGGYQMWNHIRGT